MKLPRILLAATVAAAVGVAPAALAHGRGHAFGHSKTTSSQTTTSPTTTSPSTTAPSSNAKAFGRACQAESKTHVAGTPGTPFSTCVRDMAQLAKGSTTNPHRACANESKKHVAGQKGTPYSQCVSAAAKLRKSMKTSASGS